MEGAEPNAFGIGADEVLYTFAHFLGGLVGKGNGQDMVGSDAFFEEIGNAARKDLSLA